MRAGPNEAETLRRAADQLELDAPGLDGLRSHVIKVLIMKSYRWRQTPRTRAEAEMMLAASSATFDRCWRLIGWVWEEGGPRSASAVVSAMRFEAAGGP